MAHVIFRMRLHMQTSIELASIISSLWLARNIVISFCHFVPQHPVVFSRVSVTAAVHLVTQEHHPSASAAAWGRVSSRQ